MILYYRRNHGKTIELGDVIKVAKGHKYLWNMMMFAGEESENWIDLDDDGPDFGTFFSKLDIMRMKKVERLFPIEKKWAIRTIFAGKKV